MPNRPPLERAARALCEMAGNPPGATMNGKPLWMDYLPEARAVIEAIRDHFEDIADAQQGAAEAAESEQAAIAVGQTHTIIDTLDALLAEGE